MTSDATEARTVTAPAPADPDPLAQLEAGPIFIVGHIRSGTTWVLDLLAGHPQVADLFESLIFTGNGLAPLLREVHFDFERSEEMFGRRMGLGQWLEREEVLADVRHLCDTWLGRRLAPEHRFLVEKTPADAGSVATLAKLYPDASVIHVLRDGRDVAVSTMAARNSWQRREENKDSPRNGSRYLWSIGRGWAHQVANLRRQALTLPLPFHEVSYEDMHAHPTRTARRLFDFCAIPCDDDLLDQLLDQVHFSKLPKTGPDRFRRSGRVGDWRTEFSRLDRLLFSAAAGEVLEQTGYAPAMPKRAVQLRDLLMKYEKAKHFM